MGKNTGLLMQVWQNIFHFLRMLIQNLDIKVFVDSSSELIEMEWKQEGILKKWVIGYQTQR